MSKENIARAAKMLDAEIPGWHALIDLDKFEIFNCKHCVLGQVFGRAMEDKLTAILGEKVCYDAPDTPGSGDEDLGWGPEYDVTGSYLVDKSKLN